MAQLESNPAETGGGKKVSIENVSLKKNVDLLSASLLTIGSIIGTGIFVSPKGVLKEAGSLGMSLVVWCIAGFVSLLGALCYTELGTTYPKSGGDFTYINIFFGEFPAFLYLWVNVLIISPVGCAITSLAFSNYILEPFFPCRAIPQNAIRMIAALIISILGYINCWSVKWATRVQNAFTFGKILALVVIVIVGIYYLIFNNAGNFKNTFEGSEMHPGSLSLALYSALFSCGGWNVLNCVTEEVCDAVRNIPRAICISVLFVTAIYILTNISYFTVLTSDEILSSNAVAVTFGDKVLGIMSWIMPFSVAVSTFGTVTAQIFFQSRCFFVGAREGHLPKFLAGIHITYFTPMPSVILLSLISILYLSSTEIYVLLNYYSFVDYIFATLPIVGMIKLRYTQPDLQRPIKIFILIPILYLLICVFLVVFPFYMNPWKMSIGILIMLTGIPVYFVTMFWKDKPDFYKKTSEKITEVIKKLSSSELESKCN